jgi:hypothetical protein
MKKLFADHPAKAIALAVCGLALLVCGLLALVTGDAREAQGSGIQEAPSSDALKEWEKFDTKTYQNILHDIAKGREPIPGDTQAWYAESRNWFYRLQEDQQRALIAALGLETVSDEDARLQYIARFYGYYRYNPELYR